MQSLTTKFVPLVIDFSYARHTISYITSYIEMALVPTVAQNTWVAETFSVDPAKYEAASKAASSGSSAERADPAAISKALHLWADRRKKMAADIDKLGDSFAAAFEGHGTSAGMAKEFRGHLDTVVQELGDELENTLHILATATGGDRSKAATDARKLIQKHIDYVASDKVIAALDDNPIVPMKIRTTLTATLAAISKQVR